MYGRHVGTYPNLVKNKIHQMIFIFKLILHFINNCMELDFNSNSTRRKFNNVLFELELELAREKLDNI